MIYEGGLRAKVALHLARIEKNRILVKPVVTSHGHVARVINAASSWIASLKFNQSSPSSNISVYDISRQPKLPTLALYHLKSAVPTTPSDLEERLNSKRCHAHPKGLFCGWGY